MRIVSGKQIKFNSHFIFSKWAKPKIYGSGRLYDYTVKESHCQHRSTGPALLSYNASLALPLCKKADERYKPTHLTYTRHLVDMPDGGKVGVDEVTDKSTPPKPGLPNILYIPAGAMTSHSPRTKVWLSWFLDAGYPRVVVVNRRCASGVPMYSPQITLSYGQYNDIVGVMDYLVDMLPQEKWIVIGSCFGAQCALDYFSQPASYRDEVIGGIVDSFQFNGKKFLDTQYKSKVMLVRATAKLLMRVIVDSVLNHAADKEVYDKVSQLVDREKFKNLDYASLSTIKLVNEELIGKLCYDTPLKTEEEYYMHSTPYYDENHKNFLKIKKPLVLVYGQDDPFCVFDTDMVETLKENPNICLWLYAGGGHVCFIESFFPYTSYVKDVYLENAELLTKRYDELSVN